MAKGEKILHSDLIQEGDPFTKMYGYIDGITNKFVEAKTKMGGGLMGGGKDVKEYINNTNKTIKAVSELTEAEKKILNLRIKLKEAASSQADEIAQLNVLNLKQAQINKNLATIALSQAGSYERLNLEYRENLRRVKEMKAVTDTEKAAREKLINTTKQQNNELKKLDKQMGNHQREVGNYKLALQGLGNQFGIVGQAMSQMGNIIQIVKNGFTTLKGIMLSTGIGALVLAIGSMAAYFKEAGDNVLLFNSSLQKSKAIWNTARETLEGIGKGLWDIVTGGQAGLISGSAEIAKTIKNTTAEYGKQYDVQKALAQLQNEYNKQHIENLTKIADLETKSSEAQLFATEKTTETAAARLEAQTNAKKYTEQIYELKKAEQQLTVAIANQKYIQDPQNKTLKALEEEKRNFILLSKEEADSLKALNRRYNSLTEELKTQGAEYEKLRLEKEAAAARDIPITKMETADAEIKIDTDLKQALTRNSQDYYDHIKQQDKEAYQDFINSEEAKRQAIQDTINLAQDAGNMIFSMNQNSINAEMADAERLRDYQVDMAGDSVKKKAKAEADYNKKMKQLKTEQAKNDKNAAIFNATINLAQAIVRCFSDTGPIGGLITSVLVAAVAGFQLASIIATPIPKFRKGTERLQSGLMRGEDSDGFIIEGHKNERILTAEQNKPLLALGIGNSELPGLAYIGKKMEMEYPYLAMIANQQLGEQKETNRILKKYKFVDRDGNIVTLEGNVIRYV